MTTDDRAKSTRYLERIQSLAEAVDRLIDGTGPNAPPRLAEAIAAGEPWATGTVSLAWSLLLQVDFAMLAIPRPTADGSRTLEADAPAPARISTAIQCLRDVVNRLHSDWQLPPIEGPLPGPEMGRPRMPLRFGREDDGPWLWRLAGAADDPWFVVFDPVVGTGDHATLVWIRKELREGTAQLAAATPPAGGREAGEATAGDAAKPARTQEAPTKAREKRDQGKTTRAIGEYMARAATMTQRRGRIIGSLPTPTELAKIVGCSKTTAWRAINSVAPKRKKAIKDDAASLYTDRTTEEADDDE